MIPLLHRVLLVSLLTCSIALLPHARAQEGDDPSITEGTLQINAGDILEFLGISADPDAGFDWVLTQNGTFVEAGRDRIYRTRLTQEGTYILDGQLRSEAGDRRLHLSIEVSPRNDGFGDQPEAEESFGLEVVTTDLPLQDGGVEIAEQSPLLTLTPSPVLTGPIRLDLDTRSDSDQDGDPENDNDAADTLFSTEHNPLRLWFPGLTQQVTMRLSTTAEDGTSIEQDITVAAGSDVIPTGTVTIGDERDATVNFSFRPDESVDPRQVVYRWDFGDGRQSLIDEPTHRYGANGEYTVHVTVRELATGRLLAEGEGVVTISGIPDEGMGESSSSLATSSAAASSAPAETPLTEGSSLLWTLLKIFLVLLLTIALGAIGVLGFTKFLRREGSLQKALEEAEGKLLKKDTTAPAGETPPPTMKLKRPEPPPKPAMEETIEQAIATETVKEPSAPPPPPPAKTEAAAPAWLQKGLETSTPSSTAPPLARPVQSPPSSAPDFSPAPPPPAPAISQPYGEPAPPPDASVPPWLRTEETPSPASPAPAPAPTPAPSPSTPAPATTPTQEPEAATEDDLLPPWLREEPKAKEGGDGKEDKEESSFKSPAPDQANSAIASTPQPSPVAPPTAPAPQVEPSAPLPKADPPASPPPAIAAAPDVKALSQPSTQTALPAPPVVSTQEGQKKVAPEQAPIQLKTPTSSVSSVSSVPSVASNDAAEREQERKRRKRQRYRENLKKRKTENGTEVSEGTEGTEVSAPGVPPVTKATTPPAPAKTSPVAQDILPANPPPKADDKVQFVIKAEGVEKKHTEKKNGTKDS